jgi:hypothetical protein
VRAKSLPPYHARWNISWIIGDWTWRRHRNKPSEPPEQLVVSASLPIQNPTEQAASITDQVALLF